VTTLVDPARQIEPKLPGFEAIGVASAATPVPRFTVVASSCPEGEQLSARVARSALGELDALVAQLNSEVLDGAAELRVSLLAADCFVRRLVPALLRHLEHDDLAAAVENLAEVSGTRTVNRAVSVLSSLTYLVRADAVQVFLAAIEALEMPGHVGPEELDRRSPAMRPLPNAFLRSLAAAINRADRIMSSETSGTGDALPHPLRPSVEVATLAGHSKLRSLAS
jgi:hypothetical protein